MNVSGVYCEAQPFYSFSNQLKRHDTNDFSLLIDKRTTAISRADFGISLNDLHFLKASLSTDNSFAHRLTEFSEEDQYSLPVSKPPIATRLVYNI